MPMNNKIKHLAVWILVVVHQLIAIGWYAAFGQLWFSYHARTMTDILMIDPALFPLRDWILHHERTMTDIKQTHVFVPYLVAIAASVAVNYGLAWLIGRLNVTSPLAGLQIAIGCWFAFLVVEFANVSAFSAFGTNPWPLVFVNMGRPLLAWSVSGFLLGTWQKRFPTMAGQ